MTGRAFHNFVAPARVRPQIWRVIVGFLVMLAVYAVTVIAILAVVWILVGTDTEDALYWVSRMVETDTPTSTLLILATFGGLALGAWAAARLLHSRSLASLIGLPPVWHNFFVAAGVVAVIYSVLLFIWTFSYDAVPNLNWGMWLNYLPMALAGLLLQTGAEELAFRGYLQQQLAARFRSPIIWMVLPSMLFGLAHLDPESAGSNAWLVVLSAGAFGLAAADLTARTGNLGAAWGFHFANNTVAILILATDQTITGLALFVTPYSIDEIEPLFFLTDLGVMLCGWFVIRRLARPAA